MHDRVLKPTFWAKPFQSIVALLLPQGRGVDTGPVSFLLSYSTFLSKGQDADSNRGHHDFQFGCLSSAAYRCVRTTGLGKAFPSHRILTTIRHVPGLIAQVGVSVGVKRAICLMWCLQRLSMQLTFSLDHKPRG